LHSISAASARPMVGLGFIAVSCCSTAFTYAHDSAAKHSSAGCDQPMLMRNATN
jgi:hypothetical protein